VAVQQGRDPVGVGEDAGDVGGGREAAHHQRPPQLQQAGQLGHRPGGPRPAEHDQVLVGAADGLVDQLAGLLTQAGGAAACPELSVWVLA
jgi:hypothetical protein